MNLFTYKIKSNISFCAFYVVVSKVFLWIAAAANSGTSIVYSDLKEIEFSLKNPLVFKKIDKNRDQNPTW